VLGKQPFSSRHQAFPRRQIREHVVSPVRI